MKKKEKKYMFSDYEYIKDIYIRYKTKRFWLLNYYFSGKVIKLVLEKKIGIEKSEELLKGIILELLSSIKTIWF